MKLGDLLTQMQNIEDQRAQGQKKIQELMNQSEETRKMYENAAVKVRTESEIVAAIFHEIASSKAQPYYNPRYITINLHKNYGNVNAWNAAWDKYFEEPNKLENLLNSYAPDGEKMKIVSLEKKEEESYRSYSRYASIFIMFI